MLTATRSDGQSSASVFVQFVYESASLSSVQPFSVLRYVDTRELESVCEPCRRRHPDRSAKGSIGVLQSASSEALAISLEGKMTAGSMLVARHI